LNGPIIAQGHQQPAWLEKAQGVVYVTDIQPTSEGGIHHHTIKRMRKVHSLEVALPQGCAWVLGEYMAAQCRTYFARRHLDACARVRYRIEKPSRACGRFQYRHAVHKPEHRHHATSDL
jgi:hypothetical protein